MKKFEFRLERVLALRRQQLEVQRGRVATVIAGLKALDEQKAALEAEVVQSRTALRSGPVIGADLLSLARFEAHIRRRCSALSKKKAEVDQLLKAEQDKLRDADRKVKLLEKLESRRRAEWQAELDKEIETLAAESYTSRLQSLARAQRNALRTSEMKSY